MNRNCLRENRRRSGILSFALMIIFCATVFSQETEVKPLLPDQTIEREMTGAQTHRYEFDLKNGEFFQVRVEQKGVDVALKLLDSDKNILAEMDSPNGKQGFETLSFVAIKDGSYVLETISPNEKAEKGAYIIKRASSRTAGDKDKRRIEVERIFVEAMKARKTEGQKVVAVNKLKEALAGWEELKDDYLKNLTTQQLYEIQTPPEILSTLTELNKEISQAYSFLLEGQKLAAKASGESIAAREKLNQSLALAQTTNKKLKDKNLLDKINKSGETAGESFNTLKIYEFYTKVIESTSLQNIAQTHANLNERQEEIDYLRKAAQVYEEIINDKSFLDISNSPNLNIKAAMINQRFNYAVVLGNIGKNLNEYFGKFEEAIDYLKQSVELFNNLAAETPKAEYKWFEANQLYFIAGIYGKDSKNTDQAIKYYTESIKILRTLPNMEAEIASKLISVGIQQFLQYNFKDAFEIFNESLNISRKIDDQHGQVAALRQISLMYFHLNDKAKVAEYANQTLAILQSAEYTDSWKKKIRTRNSADTTEDFGIYDELYKALFEWSKNDGIASTYRMMENYEKSLEFYKRALDATPPLKNQNLIRLTLNSVAFTYARLEKWDEAAEYYKNQLEISRKNAGKEDIAIALQDGGWTLMESKKFDEALKYQNEALAVYQAEGTGEDKIFSPSYSNLLTEISQTYQGLGNKRLAILYGKRAVNAIQGERQRLQNLDLVSQKGFLEKKEKHYRRLADWSIEEGRLVEAERVLAMLKEEEVADYLRRDKAVSEKLSLRVEFTPSEESALKNFDKNSKTLAEIGAEFGRLEDLKRKGVKLDAGQEKRFEELKTKLAQANREFQNFLDKLAEEFKKGKDPANDLSEEFNLQSDLAEWGEGVVFIYTLVGEQHFRSILTTPKTKIKGEKEIKAADLNRKIAEFRQQVTNPNIDPRPLGKELYDILIKPLEKDLDAAKAKTILWSLDGNLRLLPLAALWDGKQYFGQKYQNVVITGKSLTRIGDQVSPNLNVLGLGVSEAKTLPETVTERKFTFSALPAVPSELASIVRTKKSPKGVLSGESLLDAGFTKKSLEEQLNKRYKIVHIASHFSLNSGDATRSFLLLGDGTALTVSEINNNPSLSFTGVELLTLSACETAVTGNDSNGREIEGFAYVAQQNGAKAILATLWSVADKSTQLLMTEFYRLRKANPKLTKADAIQLAQKAMIEGRLRSAKAGNLKGAEMAGATGNKVNAPSFQFDKTKPFAHPYYWSPFVLIGNWK